MKNAYQRFGKLVYVRRTEKAATNIALHLDSFVGEERGKAHFVSVIGGDVEIGAISAAFGNGDLFTVIDTTLAESIVSLGDRPLLFRGSIVVAGRKRPLRHLVACSHELADPSSDGSSCSSVMTIGSSGLRWSAITDSPLLRSGGHGCWPNCGHRDGSTLFPGLGTKELQLLRRGNSYWRCSPGVFGTVI